jgi:CII-binding regulator of phage lambda lysogenization HflD
VKERFTGNLDKVPAKQIAGFNQDYKKVVKMAQCIYLDKISSDNIKVEKQGSTWNLSSCSVVNSVIKVEMVTALLRSCNL